MFDVTTRQRLLGGIVVVFLALATISAQTGAIWYVGGSGSNSASCGARTSPCATVSYVLSNKVAAGDTIRVLPGTYTNQGTITLSAASHRNVTLTGDDPANRPQLLNTSIAINKGATGVTISNLRVRAAGSGFDDYVGVIGVADYPTVIDNNELWNGGQGILVRTSRQVTISNNDIHDLGSSNTDYDTHCVTIANFNGDPNSTSYSTAIRLTGNKLHNCGGDGFQENSYSETGNQYNFLIVDNNTIYNNQEQGIDTKGTDDVRIYNNDIYGNGYGGLSNNAVHGSTDRWEVYNNRFHDHANFAIFNQGGGANWKIYNNLIYNNVTSPQYNYCAVEPPGDGGTVFYGNTMHNNTDTSGSMMTCGIADRGMGSRIVNNIFYGNGAGSNDSGSIRNNPGEDSGTPNFNFVYPATCGTGQCKTGTNVRSTCLTPGNCAGFVSIAARDLHLLSNSPAINAGTVLVAPFSFDFDGKPRGQGGGWDLGAMEASALGAPTNLRIIPF
jgi:parallel beta-helix repeat protein